MQSDPKTICINDVHGKRMFEKGLVIGQYGLYLQLFVFFFILPAYNINVLKNEFDLRNYLEKVF